MSNFNVLARLAPLGSLASAFAFSCGGQAGAAPPPAAPPLFFARAILRLLAQSLIFFLIFV
jgi:hypothetical protein